MSTAGIAPSSSTEEGIEPTLLDFLAYLELERGLSRNTLEAYRSDLLQFGEYLQRRGLRVTGSDHSDIAAFLSELASGSGERPPVGSATIARKVACLRSFYRHLRREGAIEHDPTADLRGPRKTQRLPRVLSRDEVLRLLRTPRGTDPRALRDRALLEVMYACGLRASEAVGLQLADVDLEEGVLCARGKGSKERLVPIGREAVAALRSYCARGRPLLVGNGVQTRHVSQPARGGADPPGAVQDRPGARAQRGPRGEDEPPHASPYLRDASPRRRMRPALAAGDARPCRSRHHAGLHPPLRRAAEGRVLQRASAGDALSGRAAGELGARRAIVLVLDACGVGALPDAAEYGDEGTNTLAHLADAVGGLQLPALGSLGLGSILPLRGVPAAANPVIHGRLHPLGAGKDSVSGHWELMGVVAGRPLPTYPEGFPPEVITRLEQAMGHEVIGNRPFNGVAAIEQLGAEHLRTGALILYTSQDSVLQLAAHSERVAAPELYRACEAARAAMAGEHAVGRVIARPFTGREGAFKRTEGRRDFALRPPALSYLEVLESAGVEVHGVGKIRDLFAGVGVTCAHPGATNRQALDSVDELIGRLERGLVFVNLIETDQVYGHRKDVHGFAAALREFDRRLGELLTRMREGDLLVVTADHGVDPAHPGTDHTREYAPLLALTAEMARRAAAGESLRAGRHEGPLADVGASVLRWLTGSDAQELPGGSFIS